MLYTRKGDAGTTKTFGCTDRVSKASTVAEALGALDEVNSFLGLVKVKSRQLFDSEKKFRLESEFDFAKIIHQVQENLFIIQAEVAGFKKDFSQDKTGEIERITDSIEKILPPIKTFFISGGTELGAIFDISRTMARRAERRVVAQNEQVSLRPETLAYLNRLSSLLYALARYSNFLAGVGENPPSYK